MKIPSFNEANLEQVCNVLGDTSTGLTGSEIGRYLLECRIADPNPGMTKRIRLFDALVARQRRDGCANNVCAFIQRGITCPVSRLLQVKAGGTQPRALVRGVAVDG